MLDLNKIYLMDCMDGMRQFPDKYFELAIVDPPYGIDMDGVKGDKKNFFRKYDDKGWDESIPSSQYFSELFRVSKNQIIWGGNYFLDYLYNTQCFFIWDKTQRGFSFADAELAWTSFKSSVRIFEQNRNFLHQEEKTHPTQKPVKLYKWCLQQAAKPGDKILDTHGGSFSSVIACLEMGFDYIAFEIDEEYYRNGLKRIETYLKQPKIFAPEFRQAEQVKLFPQ